MNNNNKNLVLYPVAILVTYWTTGVFHHLLSEHPALSDVF